MEQRQCRLCHETRPLAQYYYRKSTGRYETRCKPCVVASACAYQRDTQSWKRRTYKKPTNQKKPSREVVRKRVLKRKYGLTPEDVARMHLAQNEACKICHIPASDSPRGLFVDHCHATGRVRGLLCLACNLLLGAARDNVTTLSNALIYLKDV